jgi:hypothetical protein
MTGDNQPSRLLLNLGLEMALFSQSTLRRAQRLLLAARALMLVILILHFFLLI